MKNQAPGGTGFRQFEFKCGVDPAVGPASGRVRKDLLGGLIGNTNHQVPVTILNIENKVGVELITTDQPATKLRINGQIRPSSSSGSLNSASGLLGAILMKNQALGGTGFRQFEFKCGVDPTVGPASGRVRKDLLGGLIGNTNHQVPVTILNVENEIGR